MDIKKGLSFIAFGFLFTLINLNLTLNGKTLNITPDFIGWILFFLAFDRLGSYVEGKEYLKWMSLVLAILSAALWVLRTVKPELGTGIFTTLISLGSAVYMFILFGPLAEIAKDYNSRREHTLRMLRIINPALLLGASVVLGIAGYSLADAASMEDVSAGQTAMVSVGLVLGIAALIAAVVTAVVLFGLRKEVRENV